MQPASSETLCSLPVLGPCSVSGAAVLQVVAVAFAHAGDQVYVAGVENVIKVRPGMWAVCCYARESTDVNFNIGQRDTQIFPKNDLPHLMQRLCRVMSACSTD